MTAGSDYIFCLCDKNYNFYKLAIDGSVTLSAQPYFLNFSPAGWDDLAVQNIRNKRYWGIDRTVSIPLAYVNDGATIIKDIFYKKGIEASVYLIIASQQLLYTPGVEYGYWYKRIYRGEVDLSTFSHAGARITCSTLEDGLPKYLKSNENTTQELIMNVPEAVMVKMDGINLHERINYQDINSFEVTKALYGTSFRMPSIFINTEGDSVGILTKSQNVETTSGLSWVQSQALDNYLLKNVGNKPISVTVTGKIEFTCTGMTSSPAYAFRARFIRSNQNISNQNDYQVQLPVFSGGVYSTGAMVVGQKYTANYSITIPLAINENLFFEGIFFGGPGADAKIEFTENSTFKLAFITRRETSYIRALRGQYMLTHLIDKLTEGVYTAAVSAYLAAYNGIVFTCGNALRGLDDAILKISWSDFFQFWDCFDSVGIYEKSGAINLARKEDMVDTINYIDLREPATDSFKISVAKEYLFNEIEIGGPELSNEVGVLNGNQEFTGKMLFSLGVTNSPAKIDKVSKVKFSPYEIEKIRITTFKKDTTDYKADNDVFALHIESTLQPAVGNIAAHYRLNRDLNLLVTAGLIEAATVFNLLFTPKRSLLRNGSFIRSSLYKGDIKNLIFKTADRNANLICDGIIEKADVNIGSLAAPFFVPVLFDGDFPAPDDLLSLLDSNPLQVFRFPFYGNYYFGIMIKTSIAPSSRKAQSYQLLSLASNDLTKLIEYYG